MIGTASESVGAFIVRLRNRVAEISSHFPGANALIGTIVSMLPMPVIMVGGKGELLYANQAAEQFFAAGIGLLMRQKISDLLPFGSPLLQLIRQTRERGASIAERNVDLSTPRLGERLADVTLTAASEPDGAVIVLLQERSLAQRIDRQLLYRGAARSMSGMAAVLAHEIKNPLAGIRGAAQLLEESVPASDRSLAQLICSEAGSHSWAHRSHGIVRGYDGTDAQPGEHS